jgi:hypothetical protein
MKSSSPNRILVHFLSLAGMLAAPVAGFAQTPLPYWTNQIPVVSIYATDPLASEAGKTGAFTVYRTGPATNSLTVFYAVGGTASNGVDYATLSNTVSISAGEYSAQIQIVPIDDPQSDTNGTPEPETVILRLTQPPYLIAATYIVGEPDDAEVFILEHTVTNIPPVVKIVTPTDGAKFYADANIQICASAFDLDGYVTTVEFFENGNSLGVVTNYPIVLPETPINIFPPYHSLCVVWSNAPPGDYTLTAVATDNGGATGTSGPVSITVLTNLPPPRTNIPPTVEIVAPQNGAMFHAGANIRICADADDVDGSVTTVEFFAGDHSLGIVTNYPIVWAGASGIFEPLDRLLCLTWSNAPPGAYALTAVATDNGGATGTSAPVNIMVTTNLPPPPTNIPPHVEIVHPTNGATFYANANVEICASAWDPDGFVKTVEFFENGSSLGVVTNYPYVIPPDGGLEIPIPIYHSLCLTWSNAPPSDYTLTAVATDNGGATGTSGPVSITVLTNLPPPPTNIPPHVEIVHPTNGATFYANANVEICASASDPDGSVKTVEFFDNGSSLGVVTNYPYAIPLGGGLEIPIPIYHSLCLTWSNAPPGDYTLTAVATDNGGATGTSAPVNITVLTNLPPPHTNIPPVVKIESPTNGATFDATVNIRIEAEAHDDDGYIKTVEFFAGTTSLGVSSNFVILDPVWPINTNDMEFPIEVFFLTWSNAPPGDYKLTAVATDNGGATGTSGPVSITVLTNLPPPPTNIPPHVEIVAPANGASFHAPANISIVAGAHDTDGYVSTVEFFENGSSLGIRTNNPMAANPINPFQLIWSNAPPGHYALTAVATDNGGATGTSAPVNIVVTTNLPPPPPPEVTIYAPDPIAVEGTNFFWFRPETDFTNYCTGTNTATLLVRRTGDTNTALTVYYDIGGTATNGVDYATIADNVTIPAGKRYALVTIVPLDDVDPAWHVYDTVKLALKAPTNTPPPYRVGWPGKAAAIILEDRDLGTNGPGMDCLPDHSFHFSRPWTDGSNFCLQVSTNLVDWTSVCTNTVVKGSAQFVDPEAGNLDHRFYRAVPATGPPSY